MTKVAFLFDRSNNWISGYLPDLSKFYSKFDFHFIYDEKELIDFDLVFVLGYTKILSHEIISSNALMLVVHESDLPLGRGFAPVQWQVLEGKKKITLCLIKISEEVDAGDICEKTFMVLNGTELYDELRQKQAKATYELISSFLIDYPNICFSKQTGNASYYRRRTIEDSKLDINKTIGEQFNLLRICNNTDWPAFFEIEGVKYSLKIEKYS
jgi:methionyl-tRNA formyltransferase